MAYVNVPKDLTKVKTKVLFNLTKRQLICFGSGALIGAGAGALLGLSASAADAKSENTWAMKSTVTMQKKSGEPVTKEHAVTASGRGMDRSSALHALEDKLAQDISAAYGK